MGTSDESFLPQIIGLFYATFDIKLGPTVLHQVPENLITSSASTEDSRSRSRSRSRTLSPQTNDTSHTLSPSPNGNGNGNRNQALLDFAPISEYIIPKKPLHGKLVTLLTSGYDYDESSDVRERIEYRVMGFPSSLTGEGGKYQRNQYIWNLCFVFSASSSLEAFEPVVRKCGRILRSAELDSAYLSSANPEHTPLLAVLEQLFEDLNSYSETSIPLDGFNSLELKLFPFFPNPPDCEDWHVPIALVDLNALKDDNWDITAARVAQHINGVNHVYRIAELADADPALTRETLRHMLYYQVVMMVDIFQYSNMYTLNPCITRLAADETIINECGAYVTRQGSTAQPWPALLGLYSKLQPGVTVHDWIEANDILNIGIDPRRFVSFGIIKGFLRRVHRWPVMLERGSPLIEQPEQRKRVEFDKSTRIGSGATLSTKNAAESIMTRQADSTATLRTMGSNSSLGLGLSPSSMPTRTPPSLSGTGAGAGTGNSPARRSMAFTAMPDSFARSLGSGGESSRRTHGTLRSGTLRAKEEQSRALEEDLIRYLDGNHHSDEIQVRFGMGWSQLEKMLGVGTEEMQDGKGRKGVALVYR